MKTVEYRLKSNPSKSVLVPSAIAGKAKKLIDLACRIDSNEKICLLVYELSKYPSLKNGTMIYRAIDLSAITPGTPKALIIQDQIYLRVCMDYADRKAKELEEAKTISSELIDNIMGFE
jgi:hypothetical protein